MSTPSPYDVMMQRKALREEEQRLQQSHEAEPPQRREEKTGARGSTKPRDDSSASGYRIVRLLPASLAMATYSDLCSCRMCELRRSEWQRRNDQSCDDLQRLESNRRDEGSSQREVVSHDAIHWDVSYELWDQVFTGVDGQLQPQVRHGIEATFGAALGYNTACDPLDPRGVDSFTSLAQRFINAVRKPLGQPSASAPRRGDGGVSSLGGGSSKRAAEDEEDLMEEDMMDDRYAEDDMDWAFDSDKDGRTFQEIALVNARKIAMRRNALLRSQLQALHEHSFPVAYEEKFYQQLATERNAVVMIALAPTMTTGPGAVIRIDTHSNSPSSFPSPASATPPRDVAIRATVPTAQHAGGDSISKEFVISTVARDVMADGNDGGFYPAAEGHAMLLREFAPTSARPPPPVATVLDGTASSIVQQQNTRSSNTPAPATASSLFSSLPSMLFGAKPSLQPQPTTAPAPREVSAQQETAEQMPTRAKSEPFCRVSEQRLHELARTTKPRPHLTTPHFLKDAPDASSVMIGFVTVRLRANGKAFTYGGMDAYVSTFGTRRCARGHGIAGRVFEEALTLLRVWDAPVNPDEGEAQNSGAAVKRYGAPAWHCRRVWLHVLSTNDAAIGFYSRRRFRQVRLFRDFYHILGGRYDALIFSRLFDARGDMNEFFDVPGETDTLALDGEYDPATHHHEEWLEQQRVPYTIDVLRERCVGNEDGYMRRTRHIAAQLAAASPTSLATASRSSDGAPAALQPSPAASAPRYVPRATPPAPDSSAAVERGGGITAGALPAGVGFQLPLKARPRGDRGGRDGDRDIDGPGDDEEEVIMDMGVQGVAVSAKPEVEGAAPPTADVAFRRPTDSPVQTTPLVRPSSLQHARPPADGEKNGERNREGGGDGGGESSGDGSRAAFSQALRDAFRGGQGRPATDLRADPADLRLVTKADAKTINATVETSDLNRRTARGDPRNTSCGGCNDEGSSAEKAYTVHDARTAELLQKERLRRHQVLSRYGADDEGARKGNDGQASLPAELSLTAVFCSIILSVIVAGIAALYVVDV